MYLCAKNYPAYLYFKKEVLEFLRQMLFVLLRPLIISKYNANTDYCIWFNEILIKNRLYKRTRFKWFFP